MAKSCCSFILYLCLTFTSILHGVDPLHGQPSNITTFQKIFSSLETSFKAIGNLVGKSGPTCFIARCGTKEEPYILQAHNDIAQLLSTMGIQVKLDSRGDQGGLPYGEDIWRYMEDGIAQSQFVLLALTPAGLERSKLSTSGYGTEIKCILRRLNGETDKKFLIPVLMAGTVDTSVPISLNHASALTATNPVTHQFDMQLFIQEMIPVLRDRIFKGHPAEQQIQALLAGGITPISSSPKTNSNSRNSLEERQWDSHLPLLALSLPPYNDLFVESIPQGSEDSYLTQVWKNLCANGSVSITHKPNKHTITGMGGVGKTQLALAYAHEAYRHNAYDVIFWIHSQTEDSLVQSYKTLLEILGISPPRTNQEIIRQVLFSLPERSRKWLLVYDNVPSASFLKDKIPQKNGHALITSRDQKGWLHGQLNVDIFQTEEAVLYLLGATQREDQEENRTGALAVATSVGCLPLALSQVAGYIRENSELSFRDYNNLFQRKAALLLAYHPEEEDYPHVVATTWAMTEEKLSPLARLLLTFFSYIEPDKIDPEWFLSPADDRSNDDVKRSVRELQRYSMIKYDERERNLSVHRLVQQVGKLNLLKTEGIIRTLNQLVDQWERLWNKKNQQYGTGFFSELLGFFGKKPPIAELSSANAQSYSIYPHVVCLTSRIEELKRSGKVSSVELTCLNQKLRIIVDQVEGVMDTTHAAFLSQYTMARAASSERHQMKANCLESYHKASTVVLQVSVSFC